jgi:hypothetical protein
VARAVEFEVTVDTSTFSAIQLQPGRVASLGWNALARWLRTHLVSFPTLIGVESTGLVVLGFHLKYRESVAFFECDAFRVRGTLRVMRRGERCQLDLRYFRQDRDLAVARLILCPVAIEDPVSLGATPATLSERLLARFESDEVESAAPARLVPERLAFVETRGALLAEGTEAFAVHRHRSEVAEQWSWTEVPALVEGAREALALETRALRPCLQRPMDSFDVEFCRPMFSFDRGEIVTRAYAVDDRFGVIHRITSQRGAVLHATVVEVF